MTEEEQPTWLVWTFRPKTEAGHRARAVDLGPVKRAQITHSKACRVQSPLT